MNLNRISLQPFRGTYEIDIFTENENFKKTENIQKVCTSKFRIFRTLQMVFLHSFVEGRYLKI